MRISEIEKERAFDQFCKTCQFLLYGRETEEFWGFPVEREITECWMLCEGPWDPGCPKHDEWKEGQDEAL